MAGDWYLKEWIEVRGLKQADLCRITGIDKASMSLWVNSVYRYNRDAVNVLADALGIKPYELLMPPALALAYRELRANAERIVGIEMPD